MLISTALQQPEPTVPKPCSTQRSLTCLRLHDSMQQPKASGPAAPALFTALLTLVTGLPHFQLIYVISTITAGSGWQLLTALVPAQGEQVAVRPSTHAQIFVRGWRVKGHVSADVLERDERRGACRVKAVTTQCKGTHPTAGGWDGRVLAAHTMGWMGNPACLLGPFVHNSPAGKQGLHSTGSPVMGGRINPQINPQTRGGKLRLNLLAG